MAETVQRKSFWRYAIFTVPLILGVGFLMGQLSNSGYGNDWFDSLRKPALMPPGWVFGVVWSTLYIFLGIAIALVLSEERVRGWTLAVGLFVAQMLLNFSWSPVFFGAHQPEPALFIIILMLALSIAATFLFGRFNRAAAWLMVPYLVWLSFASVLNYRIIELNPGV
ncbi:MAG TPA: TspO/MBR family protein [Allosphingosinicella sp.]|uniref:TspO/MBR family protein n=1 Tax=Allosphingosinicella sp. TaxID=2823234 RepID=UPI002EDB51D1